MNRQPLIRTDESRPDPSPPSAGGGPSMVAQRILAGMEKGRARALAAIKERAAKRLARVIVLANADRAAGEKTRGRARRISKKIGEELTERHIRRILNSPHVDEK